MFNLGKVKRLEAEIEGLKSTIKLQDKRIEIRESLIKSKNNDIAILKHNEMILLQNAEALRKEKTDLENNVEFLFNNLSAQKRKLIRPQAN
jgi:hypothetical protein